MIAISAPLYDPSGHHILHPLPTADMDEVTRRLNRVATLDGGAVINDSGYSASDRTFRVRWKLRGESELRAMQKMVQLYAIVNVSSREGFFRAAPRSVTQRRGEGDLELLILEEMT